MPDTIITIRSRPASGKFSLTRHNQASFRIISLNPLLSYPIGAWYTADSYSSDNTLTDAATEDHTYVSSDYGPNGLNNPPVQTIVPDTVLSEYGSYASIDLPTPLAEWGVFVGADFIIKGELSLSYTAGNLVNETPGNKAWTLPGKTYCEVRPKTTPSQWFALERWDNSPVVALGDSYEPWVYAIGHPPISPGNYDSYINQQTLPLTFHFRDEGESATCGPPEAPRHNSDLAWSAWFAAHWGTTQDLRFSWAGAPLCNPLPGAVVPFNAVGDFTRSGDHTINCNASEFVLELCLHFHKNETAGGNRIVVDQFNHIIATAWMTPGASKDTISIGVNRGILGNVGSGSGSTNGWETYVYGDVDKGSQLGLLFLPSGNLVLMFTSGGVSKYAVNRQFGGGPNTNWSSPAVISPDVADTLGVGRAMKEGWASRIG